MKKLALVAVATTAMVSSPAFAGATDSATLDVSATVADECSIEAPAAFEFASVNINQGAGANALLLKNGSQNADSGTQNIYVSCNYAAQIAAKSTANNGLLNAAGASLAANDAADFTNLIHYRIELGFLVADFFLQFGAGWLPGKLGLVEGDSGNEPCFFLLRQREVSSDGGAVVAQLESQRA